MIRRAEEKDIPRVMELLRDVLELHARIRPDIFVPGTAKYTEEELKEKFLREDTPVYVAADDADRVIGYAFCVLMDPPFIHNMVPHRSMFIDDLCVDASCRGQHVGRALYRFVLEEARRLGCYEVELNVWEGNDDARGFYEAMGMKPKETRMETIL